MSFHFCLDFQGAPSGAVVSCWLQFTWLAAPPLCPSFSNSLIVLFCLLLLFFFSSSISIKCNLTISLSHNKNCAPCVLCDLGPEASQTSIFFCFVFCCRKTSEWEWLQHDGPGKQIWILKTANTYRQVSKRMLGMIFTSTMSIYCILTMGLQTPKSVQYTPNCANAYMHAHMHTLMNVHACKHVHTFIWIYINICAYTYMYFFLLYFAVPDIFLGQLLRLAVFPATFFLLCFAVLEHFSWSFVALACVFCCTSLRLIIFSFLPTVSSNLA